MFAENSTEKPAVMVGLKNIVIGLIFTAVLTGCGSTQTAVYSGSENPEQAAASPESSTGAADNTGQQQDETTALADIADSEDGSDNVADNEQDLREEQARLEAQVREAEARREREEAARLAAEEEARKQAEALARQEAEARREAEALARQEAEAQKQREAQERAAEQARMIEQQQARIAELEARIAEVQGGTETLEQANDSLEQAIAAAETLTETLAAEEEKYSNTDPQTGDPLEALASETIQEMAEQVDSLSSQAEALMGQVQQ